MTNAELLQGLLEKNLLCDIEEEFGGLESLTGERGRVRCNAESADDGRLFAGFWLHASSSLGLAGLWTSALYRVPQPGDLLSFAVAAMRDPQTFAKGTPCTFPRRVFERFGLVFCDDVYLHLREPGLSPAGQGEAGPDERSGSTVQSPEAFCDPLREHVDDCRVEPDGLIRISHGGIELVTRLPAKAGDSPMKVLALIDGSLRGGRKQRDLLERIERHLGAAVYDGGWNCRVDWSDPYYDPDFSGERPEGPRDARQ